MKTYTLAFLLYGIISFVAPGLLILLIEFSSELGQSNPFIFAGILMYGGIVGIIGLIVYLIFDKKLKRKIIIVLSGLAFYILIIPAIWGVNSVREKIYLKKHHEELEQIATKILASEMTEEEANSILLKRHLILKVHCIPDDNLHVLFILSGMLDNCYGFCFTLTEKEPSSNCCGDLVNWKKVRNNWYVWSTT